MHDKDETKRLVNEKVVSEITGRCLKTLQNDRFMGVGIPYYKLGRSVRYSMEDVNAYIESRKIKTVSRTRAHP